MTAEQKKMQELQKELEELRKKTETKKTDNDKVVISGNNFMKFIYSILYNVFNKIAKNYNKKLLKYSDKEFKLKEFKFESPRLILVTFSNVLTDIDYEITLHHQTAYLKYYDEYTKTGEIPEMIKIDRLIKNNYKTAIEV